MQVVGIRRVGAPGRGGRARPLAGDGVVNGARGVTGGLLVALAVLRGARVIATAGPASRQQVAALGAGHVVDYHDRIRC